MVKTTAEQLQRAAAQAGCFAAEVVDKASGNNRTGVRVFAVSAVLYVDAYGEGSMITLTDRYNTQHRCAESLETILARMAGEVPREPWNGLSELAEAAGQ